MRTNIKTAVALAFVILAGLLLLLPGGENKQYFRNEGFVFGTVYTIQYEADKDYHDSLKAVMREVDEALSMFNPQSVLSRINNNEEVVTNADFEAVFRVSEEVSRLSDGAFDITVAPLVNAWGFGFENRQQMTKQVIDSLLELVDYASLRVMDHRLIKGDPRQRLDAGAVAKGFGCDKVAEWLKSKGVENMLVDIGGEMVASGLNSRGEKWAIGITKPIDDVTGNKQELQDVIRTSSVAMATSGNYRNFYYDNGVRRSHTIDPRTGYPVHHSLLSATVTASSCMRADALATCCMVLGTDSALALINSLDDAECYLIEAKADTMQVRVSDRWTEK